MIKTYENFEIDNSKIWIIGVPSGEALQVTKEGLDSLYKEKLIFYNTKYVQTGFYTFEDEDINLVMRYVDKKKSSKPKDPKNIVLFKNDFDPYIVDSVIDIINEFHEKIEIYIQGDNIGITHYNNYIEIDMNCSKGIYKLERRMSGIIVDDYIIFTDKDLLQRIKSELISITTYKL